MPMPSSWTRRGHRRAQERLGRVGDAAAQGGDRFAAAGAQVGLVVDEERRAEFGGQIEQVDTAHRQAAVGAHRGGVGQQVARQRGGIGHDVDLYDYVWVLSTTAFRRSMSLMGSNGLVM